MRYAPHATLALVLAALGGCADAAPPAVSVTDSAGVEIVTNLAGGLDAAEVWALAAEPGVEIGGGVDPEVPLFRIRAVTPLEDGRVAVGTTTPPRVLVFEADGALAATLGREGRGPGEFASVGSVVRLGGDSLAVWDPVRRRMAVYTTAGRLARELDLGDVAPHTPGAAPDNRTDAGFTHLLPGPDGSLIVFGEGVFASGGGTGVGRPALPARRIDAEGRELARTAPLPGLEVVFDSPLGTLPRPLGARTWATSADGALVVGTAEQPELRVFGPDGTVERLIRWPDEDRTVGGPHLAAWSALADSQPDFRDLLEAVGRPERFPAYEGVLATEAGELLVGDYAGPVGIWPMRRRDDAPEPFLPVRRVPERRWRIFDAGGRLTATLRTPEGFEPYALRDGQLWGVYTDELDVESVRAYALERPGR